MLMQGIAQINTAQNRINKGLQQSNKNFKHHNRRIKRQRHNPADTQRQHKSGDNLEHNMPDRHVCHQTHCQAERLAQKRNHLNRHDQRSQNQRNSPRQKRPQIAESFLFDADADVKQKRNNRQTSHRRQNGK